MFPTWFFIGLIAVFFWVVGSFFDKYLLEKYFSDNEADQGPGALIIFSALFSTVVALFLLFLKLESIEFKIAFALSGVVLGILNGAWILLYLHALNRSEVSKVVPIFQTIPIFGLVLSYIILGEALKPPQIIAASGIILGALVILHNRTDSYFKIDARTLFLMLSASFLAALTEISFKSAAFDADYWTTAFWMSIGFTLFGIFLFATIKKYRLEFIQLFSARIKQVISANSANEVLDNTADLIFLFAVIIGPVALVQSLNAYQPFIALAASFILVRIAPKYFDDNFSKQALTQKFLGILVISVSSLYLYTLI